MLAHRRLILAGRRRSQTEGAPDSSSHLRDLAREAPDLLWMAAKCGIQNEFPPFLCLLRFGWHSGCFAPLALKK